jgi:hypothetical protein
VQIRPLWSPPQPDLSQEVIHLTGRCGPHHAALPVEISEMTAVERLASILRQQHIQAFPAFGIGVDVPVVCFSEATLKGIHYLVDGAGGAPRYEPYGIAFTKQTVFEHGGGPALYVRGDEWDLVSQLPAALRGRATRYWPGADPDPGEGPLQPALRTMSLWTHEREWRIVGSEGFCFTWDQIAYVLAPDQASWGRIATSLLNPLETQARMLAGAFDDQDPVVLSAEDDVRDCAAALAGIPVRLLTSEPSPS